ncbi:hypothetical protein OKW21_004572 [Catalinimonas alkaloidigena]|uniref:hypothetical protein n=1 Tax=Catalinimonas alkaloidigena TaxID=1075417 RepID=UPI0024067E7D|nr:hypothetical protein [Catalinimonas alkaloidigena]MDF9799309.1 hypothetical protein [Catalinimonas alkaloidigena]
MMKEILLPIMLMILLSCQSDDIAEEIDSTQGSVDITSVVLANFKNEYTEGVSVQVNGDGLGDSDVSLDACEQPDSYVDDNSDTDGSYSLTDGIYGPSGFYWTYSDVTETDMYSAYVGGVVRLLNGNTLIGVGASGTMKEVSYDGETVWEYIKPVGSNGIADQYEAMNGNRIFRPERYNADFPGLAFYDLTPQGTIESGPDYSCE